MARPRPPGQNTGARSFRQLRRFHHVSNSDGVFGTHNQRLSFKEIGKRRLRPGEGLLSRKRVAQLAKIIPRIGDALVEPILYLVGCSRYRMGRRAAGVTKGFTDVERSFVIHFRSGWRTCFRISMRPIADCARQYRPTGTLPQLLNWSRFSAYRCRSATRGPPPIRAAARETSTAGIMFKRVTRVSS